MSSGCRTGRAGNAAVPPGGELFHRRKASANKSNRIRKHALYFAWLVLLLVFLLFQGLPCICSNGLKCSRCPRPSVLQVLGVVVQVF